MTGHIGIGGKFVHRTTRTGGKHIILKLLAGVAMTGSAGAAHAQAAGASSDNETDSIVVIGTRRELRTAADSAVPIDVLAAKDLATVSPADLNTKLSLLVPSFSVQRSPVFDGASFVRPASLRGLSPDETLVLVNGKRRRRSAYIDVTSRGSQGVDLSQIPSIALSRAEVLRDGASAQYGSDAIAGVINLVLKNKPGLDAYVQGGRFYAGDGEDIQAAISGGTALGDRGSFNLSVEYTHQNSTSRSRQRADAQLLIANGGQFGNAAFYRANIPDPATRYGLPSSEAIRTFANLEYALTDGVRFYSFGSYGSTNGQTGLNWRSPENNPSVFGDFFPGFTLRSIYPGGFTPQLLSDSNDFDLVAGLKGSIGSRLSWDLSGRYGRERIVYHVKNTINPTLGPLSPRSFRAGSQAQSEKGVNLDFIYQADLGLAEPLNIAFGGEYRTEAFTQRAGDPASYAVGPGIAGGLQPGAAGFFGRSPTEAGRFARHNYAAYLDVNVQLTPSFNLDVAGRHEEFSDAGSSTSWKVAGRYELSDGLAVRGSVSTGFHAPSPGQANLSSVQSYPNPFVVGQVFSLAIIPTQSLLGQVKGALPLKPERSLNLSGGAAWQITPTVSFTLDYYNIRIKDRLGVSGQFFLTPADRLAAAGDPLAQVADVARYFINGFTTRTQGVDGVLTYRQGDSDRNFGITALVNYNDTKVSNVSPLITSGVLIQFEEDRLPKLKTSLTFDTTLGRWNFLARGTYYSAWTEPFDANLALNQRFGSEAFVDLSTTYSVTDNVRVTLGVDNLFGNYPDKALFGTGNGRLYPTLRPYETEGGRYYGRLSVKL